MLGNLWWPHLCALPTITTPPMIVEVPEATVKESLGPIEVGVVSVT